MCDGIHCDQSCTEDCIRENVQDTEASAEGQSSHERHRHYTRVFEKNISTKDMNLLRASMVQALSPEAGLKYKACAKGEQKQAWLAQYVVDPETAVCKGCNVTEVFTEKSEQSDVHWLTEQQIASAECLNSEPHAQAVCSSGDLESRPHELPSLASIGVKQYRWIKGMERFRSGEKETNGVQADSSLKPDEYKEVADHMRSNFAVLASKKRVLPAKPEDPAVAEAKRRRTETKKNRGIKLRKLKQTLDTANNSLQTLDAKLTSELESKGFPEEMAKWAVTKINEFCKQHWDDPHRMYADEVCKPSTDSDDVEVLVAANTKLDETLAAFEAAWKVWNDGTGAQLKKLVA